MGGFFDFILGIFQFLLFVLVIVAGVAFWGYNTLRALSENIRECWSNIGVVGKKQVSLVNQLIDVVKGYQESEKLVMLKVSEDVSSANQLAQLHQQSSVVLSTVGGLAQKFPELKSNDQYQRLIDSIQTCEAQLETTRQKYNAAVKSYNVNRSSIPHVFYAATLGFKNAPYLEFDGESPLFEVGAMKSFISDEDGDRLNKLLGQAGNKILEAGNKAIEGSKQMAEAAHDKIKQIQDVKTAEALDQEPLKKSTPSSSISCYACSSVIAANSVFCNSCGSKLDVMDNRE